MSISSASGGCGITGSCLCSLLLLLLPSCSLLLASRGPAETSHDSQGAQHLQVCVSRQIEGDIRGVHASYQRWLLLPSPHHPVQTYPLINTVCPQHTAHILPPLKPSHSSLCSLSFISLSHSHTHLSPPLSHSSPPLTLASALPPATAPAARLSKLSGGHPANSCTVISSAGGATARADMTLQKYSESAASCAAPAGDSWGMCRTVSAYMTPAPRTTWGAGWGTQE